MQRRRLLDKMAGSQEQVTREAQGLVDCIDDDHLAMMMASSQLSPILVTIPSFKATA